MKRILTLFSLVFLSNNLMQAQTCDTLRNYNPASLFSITSDNGYLHGNDQIGGNNILSWAEQYTVAGPIQLRSLRFLPVRVSDGGGSITFNVYNDNAGVPGTVIYSQTESLANLDESFWNVLEITTPPSVNGTIWVGYDVSYVNASDTFALAGNYNLNNSSNDTYFFESGTWQDVPSAFVDINNDPLGTAFVMDLLLSNDPLPVASFTGNFSACLGGGVFNMDASGSSNVGIYEWVLYDDPFPGTTTDTDSGVNGVLTPNTPTSVTNQVVGLFAYGGCRTSDIGYYVNVYNPVSATVTPANTTCGNNNGTITVTNQQGGSGTYTYSLDGINYQGSNSFTGLAPGNYTVYVRTNGDACETTYNVTVGATPPETITVGSNATICDGDNTTLTATGNGTIAWFNGVTQIGTGNTISVSPSANTTYTATLTDANNCTDSDNITVTVNALPSVNAGNNQAICAGNSATLTATGSGSSFEWFEGVNSISNNATVTVSPTATTSYTVQTTDVNGCSSTDNITVTVNLYDDASFTFNNFCEGSSNGPVNIATPGGTFAFNPVPGDGATINSTTGEISNGVLNTTYSVEYTTNGACPSTSVETTTVQSQDDPSFTYNDVCIGNTNVPSNIATPGGTFDFNPAPGDGATIDPTTGVITNPVDGNSYTIEYTTPSGVCQASSTETVSVFVAPTVTASNDEAICEGETANITASGASSYEWDNNVGTGANQSVNPTTTTTYEVTGTDANGCTGTDQVVITVHPLPSVDAGLDQEVCEEGTVTLTATGADSYSWDNGLGAGASQSVTPASTTTYTVTGADSNGCENTDQVVVTVLPGVGLSGTVTPVNGGNNGEIDLTVSGGDGNYTFAWDNGATTEDLTGLAPGTYTVIVTDGNGCEAEATFIVDDVTGISEYSSLNVQLYPNPAREQVNVVLQDRSFEYAVTSAIGKTVTQGNAENNAIIPVNQLESGVYFITIHAGDQSTTLRLIVQH